MPCFHSVCLYGYDCPRMLHVRGLDALFSVGAPLWPRLPSHAPCSGAGHLVFSQCASAATTALACSMLRVGCLAFSRCASVATTALACSMLRGWTPRFQSACLCGHDCPRMLHARGLDALFSVGVPLWPRLPLHAPCSGAGHLVFSRRVFSSMTALACSMLGG